MSTLNVLFRILSILFLLGGVFGGGAFLASGTALGTMAAGGPQPFGPGLAPFVSLGAGLTILAGGLIASMVLWWMGNVHDYLRDVSETQ